MGPWVRRVTARVRALGGAPRFWLPLGAITALGLLIRIVYVVKDKWDSNIGGDAWFYHWQARLIAEGHGFIHPGYYYFQGRSVDVAAHPPLFPLTLAAADLVNLGTPQAQRIVMCVVGAATVVVIALAARRIAGATVGLIAGVLAALYPYLWTADGMLLSETLFTFLIATSVLFAFRYRDSPSRREAAFLAAFVTLAALTRAEAILLLPLVVVPWILMRATVAWRQRIGLLVAALGVSALILAPWVTYNAVRFGRLIVTSDADGTALAAGNCDLTYSGPLLGFGDNQCFNRPPYLTPPGHIRGNDFLRSRALQYMRDHAGELPKVAAARIGRAWDLYGVSLTVQYDAVIEGRGEGPSHWGLWMYYTMIPFAIGGALLLRHRRVPIYPIAMLFVITTLGAVMFFGATRYRAGAEPGLVLFAAVGVGAVARAALRRFSPPHERDKATAADQHVEDRPEERSPVSADAE